MVGDSDEGESGGVVEQWWSHRVAIREVRVDKALGEGTVGLLMLLAAVVRVAVVKVRERLLLS